MPSKIKKPKRRYITFKVHSPKILSRKEFISAIRQNISGKEAWDKMQPWLTVFQDNEGILRCNRNEVDKAKELLISIKSVGREQIPVTVETLGTSGTIKKAKGKYLSEAYKR